MKSAEKKQEFIRLRAEGKSYRAIEAEAGISRSTCSAWEKELRAEIDRLRKENLEALYEAYGMTREARIRRLGDTLSRIDNALEEIDLRLIPPEKLLDFKLKYQAALKEEHTAPTNTDATGTADNTLEALSDLYRRFVTGDTNSEQAKMELSILAHLVEGYNRANPFESAFM